MDSQNKYDIFISWRSDNQGIGKNVANNLKYLIRKVSNGLITAFSSNVDIKEGWSKELNDALESADYGILLLTPEAMDSFWMSYEFGVLRGRHKIIRMFHFPDTIIDRDKTPFTINQDIEFTKENLLEFLIFVHNNKFPNVDVADFKDSFDYRWNEFVEKTQPFIDKIDKNFKRNYVFRNSFQGIKDESDRNLADKKRAEEEVARLKNQLVKLSSSDNSELSEKEKRLPNESLLTQITESQPIKWYKKYKLVEIVSAVFFLIGVICFVLSKCEIGQYKEEFVAEYVDLDLSSGTLWATCNLGAQYPWEDGDYFAWGETKPKTTYTWDTYKYANKDRSKLTKYCYDEKYGNNGYTDNLSELEVEDDAAAQKTNWRTPSLEQFNELKKECNWQWTQEHGINGYVVTSQKNSNHIFLPASGDIYGDSIKNKDEKGLYWLLSFPSDNKPYANNPYMARCINLEKDTNKIICCPGTRCFGFSIRPVRAKK